MKNLFRGLSSADFVSILFLLFCTFLELVFHSRISGWFILIPVNVLIITFILLLAHHIADVRFKELAPIGWIDTIHMWYLFPLILYSYKQTSFLVRPIRRIDFDQTLIAIDRWLFGVDPTKWITQFSHPLVTEILQIAYSSYYILFIVLFYELYRRNNKSETMCGAFLVVYGFYLSYIGYLFVPAVGPRFTLHDFNLTSIELPGLFFTEPLRWLINAGGGIPPGVQDPLPFVQRDAFPSGHTQLTLIAMYYAFKTNVRTKWGLLVTGSLLIVATIYMRYHYVIDIIGGVCFFFFTVWSGRVIDRWLKKLSVEETFE